MLPTGSSILLVVIILSLFDTIENHFSCRNITAVCLSEMDQRVGVLLVLGIQDDFSTSEPVSIATLCNDLADQV